MVLVPCFVRLVTTDSAVQSCCSAQHASLTTAALPAVPQASPLRLPAAGFVFAGQTGPGYDSAFSLTAHCVLLDLRWRSLPAGPAADGAGCGDRAAVGGGGAGGAAARPPFHPVSRISHGHRPPFHHARPPFHPVSRFYLARRVLQSGPVMPGGAMSVSGVGAVLQVAAW